MRILKQFVYDAIERLAPLFHRELKLYQDQLDIKRRNTLIARMQCCGEHVRFNGVNHTIQSPEKLIIGNNVHFGSNLHISATGGVIIGDNTHFSRNITVYSANHDYHGLRLPYDQTHKYKPVTIGKNVWIGMNACILPGVTIHDGAIIGMGSVVNRDVQRGEIVGNNSLTSLKYRNAEHYRRLEESKEYGGPNGLPIEDAILSSFRKTYQESHDSPMVFVLSTGRSGSTSIVDILNQHPSCRAFHEDISQLIRISTELAHGEKRQQKYYDELDTIFNYKLWQADPGEVLIHSDQRLWNLVGYLGDYFPNSKFVHLVREPIACIKSMIARGWYAQNEYPEMVTIDHAKYRLQGDKTNDCSKVEWEESDAIFKCSWYYYYINSQIKEQLDKLPESRSYLLQLENLDDRKQELCNFILGPGADCNLQVIKSNQVKQRHQNKYDRLQEDDSVAKKIRQYLNEFSKKSNA